MENAHLRLGRLTFVRQSRESVTHVSLHLDRLVAESSQDRSGTAALHFLSVFGGDAEIGAIATAAAEGRFFHCEMHGQEAVGTLGEKPILYRASLQVPGRKRPVRHLVAVSKILFETTLGADGDARGTVLYDNSPAFVLHRLAVRFGLPVLPEWAEWFSAELGRRRMIEDLIGFNCSPVAVKGNKIRMLRILAQGLRRRQIHLPSEVPATPAISL